jgi:hypothetical protein
MCLFSLSNSFLSLSLISLFTNASCVALHFEWVRLWDANNMLFFLIERKREREKKNETRRDYS